MVSAVRWKKTEVVIEIRRSISIGELIIERLTDDFFERIKTTANKVAMKVSNLSRLMTNVGVSTSTKRCFLMSATQFSVRYSTGLWTDAAYATNGSRE